MKNPLKRRKLDKIIKDDILVRVWNKDKEYAVIRYLFKVESKYTATLYPFLVWKCGKTAKENGYNTDNTNVFKHAELVEPEETNNPLLPEIQEFCDKYKVWCAMNPKGEWSWYKSKPKTYDQLIICGYAWISEDEDYYTVMPIQPKYKGDWTKTLHGPKGKK